MFKVRLKVPGFADVFQAFYNERVGLDSNELPLCVASLHVAGDRPQN
jgi:hypothetical protein